MSLRIDACTAQHIGDREEQQDRVALHSHPQVKGALLAVLADGMGGHAGGALAAEQVLHQALQNFCAGSLRPEAIRETLASGIRDAHDSILLTRFTSEQDPHSTACLLILQPGRADWAHCGDSRIYHFRDGECLLRSQDHSYVMDLVQQGLITEEQAEIHPNKNILTSCLGDEAPPRINFGVSTSLVAGDCFLLCSDGLWAYFTDEELGKVLKHFAPRRAAEVLIATARDRAQGRGDNCSLAVISVVEPPEPKTAPTWA